MKKQTRTNIIRFSYIGATIVVLILIASFNEDFDSIPAVLSQLNAFWLLITVACLMCYWLTDGWLLGDITSYMSPSQRLSYAKSLKIGLIGLYYGALTPSSTGGQPAQVIYMNREKIPVGVGTCIVLVKFIAYSLTVIAYYLISMAFMGDYYYQNYIGIYWFSLLGFIINALAIALVVLSIVKKDWMIKAANGIIAFLHRIKIMKQPEKAQENIAKTIEEYSAAGKYITQHKRRSVGSFFISMANIGFLFAITYCIYRAFGLDDSTFMTLMMLQSLLYTAVAYFPLPGAAGASESGFYVIFSTFFSKGLVVAAMILWRIMTYYIILAVGSLIVVFDELAIMRRQKKAAAQLTEE